MFLILNFQKKIWIKIKQLDSNDSLFFNHQDPGMVEWFDEMVKTRRKKQD